MHHSRFIAAAAAAAMALASASAQAGDLFVVSGANVTLSADEVREVFLGDKQFAGSVKLAPVENGSLQADFQARVLKVDAARYASIWSKKGFREGLTPPPVRSSDADVINAIKANPGAVGYVSKPTPDVKVVQKY
jgi:hypothetical protein